MSRKKAEKKEEGGFTKWLAWTIALGLVFSAGLITGQRLLRRESLPPMVSLSSTRAVEPDKPQPSIEEPPLRTTFSFYEHLTAAEPAKPAQAPKPAEGAPTQVKPSEEAKPAPKPEPTAPSATAEAKPAPMQPKPEAPEQNRAESQPPSTVGEAAAALQKVVDSFQPQDADENALPARYTLQVSSHPDRDSAEKEMDRLRGTGVEPHVLAVDVPGKGKLYRIRVGKFHSMDEARNFQGQLKEKRGVAGFVTPL